MEYAGGKLVMPTKRNHREQPAEACLDHRDRIRAMDGFLMIM